MGVINDFPVCKKATLFVVFTYLNNGGYTVILSQGHGDDIFTSRNGDKPIFGFSRMYETCRLKKGKKQ